MLAKLYLQVRAFVRRCILHIDDRSQLEIAIANGLKMGRDCNVMGECIIDPGHCWLIEIGNRVSLAPRVHILAHDASTKRALGYTRLGAVSIGDDVFIGAGTIVLPGVTIGGHVIIGAGSVVSRDIPDNSVAVGVPAKVVGSYDEYMKRHRDEMLGASCYDSSYTIGHITEEKKEEMIASIRKKGVGFVV